METITDPAAIRACDEPDERGDFPCCTTPAPVGAAMALDLDAVGGRFATSAMAQAKAAGVLVEHPGAGVSGGTVMGGDAEITRLRSVLAEEIVRAEAAEAEVVTLRAKVAAVEAWPLTLEQVHAIVDYLLGDGSRDGLIHGDTLNRAMGASARRRAALAVTAGEGE